jgi:hypothetical protein
MKRCKSKTSCILVASGLAVAIVTVSLLAAGGSPASAQPQAKRNAEAMATEASAHPRGKADAALPKYEIVLDPKRVALMVTDPQNDFLSPDGVTWGVVGESVTENGTVDLSPALQLWLACFPEGVGRPGCANRPGLLVRP